MHTNTTSLRNIYNDLSEIALLTGTSTNTPTLSSYSPIPSMQHLANQHSSAISASTGCATLVSNAIMREIEWSTNNIKSLVDSLTFQEKSLSSTFDNIMPQDSLHPAVSREFYHSFAARPEFQVGNLIFHPATLTSEYSQSAEALLKGFEATSDGAIFDAQRFWANLSEKMTTSSDSILVVANQLEFDHDGEVFSGAATHLRGLSERIKLVVKSSEEMVSSLDSLPEIKNMSTSTIRGIIENTSHIPNKTTRIQMEGREILEFLNTRFLPQIQTALPTISSLTTPHHAGNLSSVDSAATSSVGRFEGQVHQTERLIEPNSSSATSAMTVNALPPSNSPIAAPPPSPQGTTTPNGLGSIGHNTYSPPPSLTSPLPNTSRQQPPGPGRTFPNSLMFGSSPQIVRSVPPRGNSGAAGFPSDRQNATALHRNLDRSSSNVPSPPRHIENSNSGTRTLGSPHSSGGAGGQSIHGNTASDKSRAHTGAAPRAGTPVAPINSMSRAAKGNSSPIDKVYKSRRTESSNANQKRLFGLTEPTVPGILGADLRE